MFPDSHCIFRGSGFYKARPVKMRLLGICRELKIPDNSLV